MKGKKKMLNKTNGKKDKNLLITHAWEKLANCLKSPRGPNLMPQLLAH